MPTQRVTIWLPPEYDAQSDRRFPVLYMWDGQNLLDPSQTQYNKAWMVQDVLKGMVARGEAEPHIVVGIWSPSGKDRYRSYVPQFAENAKGMVARSVSDMAGGPIASERQLGWVADTLIPQMERDYRARTGAENRTIVGASMGGVMSCYSIIERPEVFGRAGCVSAHLAMADPQMAPQHDEQIAWLWDTYLDGHLGNPNGRRIWMDHGAELLDSYYGPWQIMLAEDFAQRGWREGEDFTARVYDGAEHDENFWRERMPEMLTWLWREK
nr:alpha/beta hydrolase-fold protein [Qipengyuania sphaerica]